MPASLTATKRLDWCRDQRETLVAEITAIAERAADEDRDLSEAEHASCQRKREAVEKLDADISIEVESCERNATYADLSGRIQPALQRARTAPTGDTAEQGSDVVFRSTGDYLATFLRSRKDGDAGATQRIDQYRQTLTRANQILDSNPGVVPTPIVGPVINSIDNRRPAIDAATRRPLPSAGKSFTRPVVTQHTLVGIQAAEKTPLASRELLISELTVEKFTRGGYVNLSWQDQQWSEPAILDIIVSDLAAAYAAATDAAFCATLLAGVTQTVSATTGATPTASTPESWLAAIYEAAALVFAAGNATPDRLWVSPDVWAQLGSLVDGAGRAMFPSVAPQNAMGALNPGSQDGNVAGFRLAVDAHFPPGTAILGDSLAAEFYEQVGGMVSAQEPTLLGTAIAFYGFSAAVVVRPTALVSITSA